MSPSPRPASIVSESTGTEAGSTFTTSSIIACRIAGTPAMTKTFLIRNPGAAETAFRMSAAPSGIRAILSRLSFGSIPRPFQNGRRRSTAR